MGSQWAPWVMMKILEPSEFLAHEPTGFVTDVASGVGSPSALVKRDWLW